MSHNLKIIEMKKAAILLWFLCGTVLAFAQNNFEITSKSLAPGSVINFDYMPRNTVLQGIKDFEAVAYLFEGGMPRAVTVPLKQEGGLYKGSVKTADSTKAVFFAFSKDDKNDNNNNNGYYAMLKDKSGKPVVGAQAAVGEVYSGLGGFLFGVERNADKAAEFSKLEFENPAAKEKLFQPYLSYLMQSKDPDAKEKLKAELARRAEKKDSNEEQLMLVKKCL